jgi:hypothetical protein
MPDDATKLMSTERSGETEYPLNLEGIVNEAIELRGF